MVCTALCAPAAPVPKEAGKNDPTPDLKAVFDAIEKAVANRKWPKEDDEKLLLGSAQVLFDRALKAGEQKARKLPVESKELKKLKPVAELAKKDLDESFLIAGDVRECSVRDSVIFASGQVEVTSATNSIIFGRHVNCVAVENCLIVASEYIGATSAWRPFDTEPSVLIAGQWIRAATMDATICHTLKPDNVPAPGESMGPFTNTTYPAIQADNAKKVIFLNAKDDVRASEPKDCKYLPQKTPIAK